LLLAAVAAVARVCLLRLRPLLRAAAAAAAQDARKSFSTRTICLRLKAIPSDLLAREASLVALPRLAAVIQLSRPAANLLSLMAAAQVRLVAREPHLRAEEVRGYQAQAAMRLAQRLELRA
jgi:hypothetical protein